MMEPLLKFTSHVAGKNAEVEIHPDRIDWSEKRKLHRRGNSEMIPIKSITSVVTKRDGLRQAVSVVCPGNTIDFRVSKGQADGIKSLLTDLMLGRHSSQQPSSGPD